VLLLGIKVLLNSSPHKPPTDQAVYLDAENGFSCFSISILLQ
jgi:hypothetical protein